jgi:hypothetical protein
MLLSGGEWLADESEELADAKKSPLYRQVRGPLPPASMLLMRQQLEITTIYCACSGMRVA